MKLPNILITGEAGHGKDTIGEYLVSEHGYIRTAFADPLKNEIIQAYAQNNDDKTHQVTLDVINDRLTKTTPKQSLALMRCGDNHYVRCALNAFMQEDTALLKDILSIDFNRADPRWVGMDEKSLIDMRCFSEMSLDVRVKLPRSPRRIAQIWGTEYRRADNDTYWVEMTQKFIETQTQPVVICDGRFANETGWANKAGVHRIHVYRPNLNGLEMQGAASKHSSEQIPPPDKDTLVIRNEISGDGFADLYAQIEAALMQIKGTAVNLPKKMSA